MRYHLHSQHMTNPISSHHGPTTGPPPEILVTVVIPAYNAEAFLSRAMQSVLSQTHSHLELLVVDDGSADRTAELARSVNDTRVSVFSGPNRGPSAARNVGLQRAKGPFVAFLDADDYWFPEKLASQLLLMTDNTDLLAVGTLMRYESLDGTVLGTAGQKLGPMDQESIANARLMPFPLSSILFRKTALDQVGGFDESLEVAEDLDLMAQVARLGALQCVPSVLGSYRVHDASLSARRFRLQRAATRFIRARLAAADTGEHLTWKEFQGSYGRTFRQRYGDRVQAWYRAAGQSVAERRWLAAFRFGSLALVAGPRYTLKRLYRQRVKRIPG